VNVLPWPGPALVASMAPPCWSMIWWLMNSPRPVPLPVRLRVKNGSKMFCNTSAAMPQPVSANAISALVAVAVSVIVRLPVSSMLSRAFTTRFKITDFKS